MIIGRGDIAKEIPDREGFIFYANGYSNRTGMTEDTRKKEMDDIRFCSHNNGEMFVYFSTLSIYYSESHYTVFKSVVEKLIHVYHNNYCIMRLGNITWGSNPNTLINYLKRDQSRVENVYRYLLDKEEFKHWIGMIPKTGKHEMNITGRLTYVPDLVKQINEGKIYSDQQRPELLPFTL